MAEAGQFGKPEFELTGGALCLDFANTGAEHKGPPTEGEKIHSYAEFLSFAVQTGDLSIADARKLLLAANHSPAKAESLLRKGRAMREVIYRIFSSLATEHKPSRQDLDELNTYAAETLKHSRVIPNNGGFTRAWDDLGTLDRPLWPIISSALDLLTSEEAKQVRQCGSEKCSWLFVDRSRNSRRRWCDMKTCGNRAKARRHYERVKSD